MSLTASTSLSTVLFLSSAFISWTISFSKRLFIEQAYADTIKRLLTPVKSISRHSLGDLSTDEVYKLRKEFFSNLFNQFPVSKTCKVIHVAGTKGKGSTVAYLSSSISSAGHKVGVFTSPHLHTARERIKINGDLISKTAMTKYGTQAYELLADKSWVVFFDLLLATAILYFGNKEVDYILLETGIGGRYDSTNFLDYCDCAIITSISLDHQSFLGETVEKIAWQKAGIIKKNSIVFTPASQKSSVIQVLQKQCDELNAILNIIPADRNQIDCDEVNISYGVQLENASTTAAALKFLRISRSGMKNFYWPCRMEEFRVANRQIVIDGCHNGDSVERFLRNLREKVFNKKIVVMFGAGQDKCLDAMLNIVFESADKVVMIQASHFKSLSEYELLSRVPANKQNLIYPFQVMVDKEQFLRDSKGTVQKRIETILKDDEFNAVEVVIAVCGSLFSAAEARESLFRLYPHLFPENDWVREADGPKCKNKVLKDL